MWNNLAEHSTLDKDRGPCQTYLLNIHVRKLRFRVHCFLFSQLNKNVSVVSKKTKWIFVPCVIVTLPLTIIVDGYCPSVEEGSVQWYKIIQYLPISNIDVNTIHLRWARRHKTQKLVILGLQNHKTDERIQNQYILSRYYEVECKIVPLLASLTVHFIIIQITFMPLMTL